MKRWRILTEDRRVPPLGTIKVISCRVLDTGLVEWIVDGPGGIEELPMYCLGVLSVGLVEPEHGARLDSAHRGFGRVP